MSSRLPGWSRHSLTYGSRLAGDGAAHSEPQLIGGLWRATRTTRQSGADRSRSPRAALRSLSPRLSHAPQTGRQTATQALVAAVRVERRATRIKAQLAKALSLSEPLTHGPLLGATLLEDKSVSDDTKRDYLRRVTAFLAYVEQERLSLDTVVSVDDALTRYANYLYKVGELAGEGEKLKASWEAVHTDYARNGPHGLPRLARALKGWKKLAPSQTQWPMPETVADAIADVMRERKQVTMAVCVLLRFRALFRPSEAAGLAVGDVIQPVAGEGVLGQWSLLLAPFERGVSTKTQHFDEAISLADSRAPWLGPLLGRLKARRRRQLSAQGIRREDLDQQPLWEFSHAEFLEAFRTAARSLDVLWLAETLYVLRHGGASRDALGLRDLNAIMRRGRWGHISSIKHYEKHGRLQWILGRVDRAVLVKGRAARTSFSTLLRD